MATVIRVEEGEAVGAQSPELTASPDSEETIDITVLGGSKARAAGRKTKFSEEDDLIIVRKVCAAKAHVAPYGSARERFEKASRCANKTGALSVRVSGKSIRDRYKKLQENFDKKDKRERAASGLGGELDELDDLLASMSEARDDVEAKKSAEKATKEGREEKKEEFGRKLVQMAMHRRAALDEGGASDADADADAETPASKKRKIALSDRTGDDDLDAFATTMRNTDMARVEIERERLELERDRLKEDKVEREREREERREDRKAHSKLELEKFKLMMEMFSSKK